MTSLSSYAVTLLLLAVRGPSCGDMISPVGNQVTVSFRVFADRWYSSGPGKETLRRELVRVPGIGKCYFVQSSAACLLGWDWEEPVSQSAGWMGTYVPELPGPEWYHVLYTWDSERGLFDGYLNGTSQRECGIAAKPWPMPSVSSFEWHQGPMKLADVRVEGRYLPPDEVGRRVPAAYRGRRASILGQRPEAEPIDTSGRLGRLLYQSDLSGPKSIEGWVMEGPGIVEFVDGWMRMSSPIVDGKPKGHIVHWCPADFPQSFVAEWDCRFVSESGLNIVFFAARGVDGRSIFDPSLPTRDGAFKQYTSGPINCYHISYCASSPEQPGRGISNLRKNSGFYLVSNGPPGIDPGDTAPHRLRLIKDGAHIQCQVDGRVFIDWTDDGKRYGPVHGGGRIGLRQMEWSVTRYKDFRVWELLRGSER